MDKEDQLQHNVTNGEGSGFASLDGEEHGAQIGCSLGHLGDDFSEPLIPFDDVLDGIQRVFHHELIFFE